MDPSLKETLLDRLSSYLDGLDAADAETAGLAPTAAETPSADEEARDLFSVFVELAAVRNEARAQARIVKEAFDQFRAVFETLQSSNAALDRELKEAHARAREQSRSVLRPLLIDIIDVRDRLSAGLAAAPHERAPSWWALAAERVRARSVAGGPRHDAAPARPGAGGPARHSDCHRRTPLLARRRARSRRGTIRPSRKGG
jgi:molecular chaperone GrpE